MLALWLASIRLRDAGIIDPFWGFGFALVGWVAYLALRRRRRPALLLAVLVSVWACGCSATWPRRKLRQAEDFPVRRHCDAGQSRARQPVQLVSLGTVFGCRPC